MASKPDENPLDQFDEAELQELYSWIDGIPLSRPKRNIARDFADGVLISEIIHYHIPKLVELHNYTAGSSTNCKLGNWQTLNTKVFSKLGFEINDDVIRELIGSKPGCIERFLMLLRQKLNDMAYEMQRAKQRQRMQQGGTRKESDQPEADQYMHMGSPGRGKKGQQSQRGADPSVFKKSGMKTNIYDPTKQEKVPRLLYEEKEQECLAKDETVKIMQAKVQRLEHLLHLKDVRIEDLQSRLEALRPTGGKR
ncbi:hypothetical protein KUTeg_004989 [Tegillarca granosa]|uniref:Calponin-homology (CH) domain-containing protein n=1 Tax=Tegillarca granosa TaxID=220873 RepID=A0ABQ9FN05_TEGGR|nr:hypothetical protein KUTeg_004989 [Tegillarca granosa]